MLELTHDSIFHGALRITQHREGYRFSEDAVLLAAFAARGGREPLAVDLGAGGGVVGLMLLHAGAVERVVALELQEGLAFLARRNGRENGFRSRLLALRGDLRTPPLPDHSVRLVVSNPPYRPAGTGKRPPNQERALARHELTCTLGELCRGAERLLVPGGRLAVIYPAWRRDEIPDAMRNAGLTPSRMQTVLPGPGRSPSLVLFEGRAGRRHGILMEEEPMVTRGESGDTSPPMEALLSGRLFQRA